MAAENLSCKQLAEHLSAYLDGQLDEELSAIVELHLTGCQQCRATLAHWQRLQQAIRSSELRRPALDLAEHMTSQIERDQLLAGMEHLTTASRPVSARLIRYLATAAVLALMVCGGYFTYQLIGRGAIPTKSPDKQLASLPRENEPLGRAAGDDRALAKVALERPAQQQIPARPVSPVNEDKTNEFGAQMAMGLAAGEPAEQVDLGRARLRVKADRSSSFARKPSSPPPMSDLLADGVDFDLLMAGAGDKRTTSLPADYNLKPAMAGQAGGFTVETVKIYGPGLDKRFAKDRAVAKKAALAFDRVGLRLEIEATDQPGWMFINNYIDELLTALAVAKLQAGSFKQVATMPREVQIIGRMGIDFVGPGLVTCRLLRVREAVVRQLIDSLLDSQIRPDRVIFNGQIITRQNRAAKLSGAKVMMGESVLSGGWAPATTKPRYQITGQIIGPVYQLPGKATTGPASEKFSSMALRSASRVTSKAAGKPASRPATVTMPTTTASSKPAERWLTLVIYLRISPRQKDSDQQNSQ